MEPTSKDNESKQALHARLFGGIFSTLEECPGATSSPLYSRAIEMLDKYLESGLDREILQDDLVDWINSPVLDALKEDYSFDNLCLNGYFELVKWYLEKYPDACDHNPEDSSFTQCCQSGNLELVQWMVEKYPQEVKECISDAFYWTCFEGYLEVAMWLDGKFHLDKSMLEVYGLNQACQNGNFDMVKWLVQRFPDMSLGEPQTEAYRSGNTELFRWILEKVPPSVHVQRSLLNFACTSGDLETVKFLAEKFPKIDIERKHVEAYKSKNLELFFWVLDLSPPDMYNQRAIMECACQEGDLDTAKILAKKYPKFNDYCSREDLLNFSCTGGNIKLLEWFLETFPGSYSDVINNEAFPNACELNLEVAKWLLERFPDTDVHANHDEALRKAIERGDKKTATWLFEKFAAD